VRKSLHFLAAEDSPSRIGGRYLQRLTLDQEIVPEPAPTINQLIRHAERYGSAGVVQTAIDLGYDVEAVIRLQSRVDTIDVKHAQENRPWTHRYAKRPKKSAEVRVKKMMGVTDEDEAV
jgi:hypothetical protein